MKETKYIFLDIDGTLFSPSLGAVPQSAREAIRLTRERGNRVFLCTGRSLGEVSSYLNDAVDGFIMAAGAMIYADGKRIYDHPIDPAAVTRLKKLVRSFNQGYSLEGSAGAYCDEKGYEALLWYFSAGETNIDKRIANAMKNCTYPEEFGDESSDKIYKVCTFGKSWEPTFPKIAERLEEPFIITKSYENNKDHFCTGEITDSTQNKKTGIERLLDHYNAESFSAYGFGDSGNDIPMFEACHAGIAMGNGTAEVKAAADYITDSVDDNGIWNAFVHYHLIEGEKK